MVTVIPNNDDLIITSVKNGHTGGNYSDLKDYQEVDFNRTSSCKPLPEDLFSTIDGQITKSSINGTFYLQIDGIEPFIQDDGDRIILTLTDGIRTVKAMTHSSIPNLSFNTKIGSKLLLTDSIPIENNLLQLTHDNTKFQYGSNTHARPRSNNKGRSNGSQRPTYEGRRNSGYNNHDSDNNFMKRPPPKTTLMDFMTSLKISHDDEDDENEKAKERSDNNSKRQSNGHIQSNHEQNHIQQDGFEESLNSEEDPSHANYRERRNPLPPRLQRAQEERSRRNPNHYYDESILSINDPSSSTYLTHTDQSSYISNSHSHPSLHTYSTPTTHLTYYQGNPTSLTYISNPSYHNQQTLLTPSYTNEHYNYCCGISYGNNTNYLSTNVNNGNNISSDNDENNDSGIKSESSLNEQKSTTLENKINFQEEKSRNLNSTPRHRWHIGDVCLARWSIDGEFYCATIVGIQPPYTTVLFQEYNDYDQVHFNDLKILPRDQQFYPIIPTSSTDYNMYGVNGYYPTRPDYYPQMIDGCIMMPEAPPFPFNSAGTLYMYPPTCLTSLSTSNDYQNDFERNDKENDNLIIDSSSSPSKDSNDTTSAIDSTSISNDENLSLPQPCSVADTSLALVTSDDLQIKKSDEEDENEKS